MNQNEPSVPQPVRSLHLLPQGGYLQMVDPAGQTGVAGAFSPFNMPQFRMSMLASLSRLGESMWDMYGRCFGIVLLIDCAQREWTFRIPTQRCSADSASWTVDAEDLPDLTPDLRLAGSFQTLVTAKTEDLIDAVPEQSGLHLLQRIWGDHREVASFLRLDNGAVSVSISELTLDDWQGTIKRNRRRFHLC